MAEAVRLDGGAPHDLLQRRPGQAGNLRGPAHIAPCVLQQPHNILTHEFLQQLLLGLFVPHHPFVFSQRRQPGGCPIGQPVFRGDEGLKIAGRDNGIGAEQHRLPDIFCNSRTLPGFQALRQQANA